jgi:hypothetical protein
MLIPVVTDRAKHMLGIEVKLTPVVSSEAVCPTVEDVMGMRRMLRQRGVVVRERRKA